VNVVARFSERPPSPYSLPRTVATFARFPAELIDRVDGHHYRRLIRSSSGPVLSEVHQGDSPVGDPRIEISFFAASALAASSIETEVLPAVRRVLALDEDISTLRRLFQRDATLRYLDTQLKGLRRVRDPGPLEGLISSILAQQITIRYAATLRSRLVRRYGDSAQYRGVEYFAFPAGRDLVKAGEDDLRALGMTAGKARAILAVAAADVAGELDLDELTAASDDVVIQHLIRLPGVGRWTAEWFLVNVLGRSNVVPAGDLGIRRETGRWFLGGEMPSELETRRFYERFGELQGYVAYYVLSAARLGLALPGGDEG
jgi:DNA-3-methyladenine glycosylase II